MIIDVARIRMTVVVTGCIALFVLACGCDEAKRNRQRNQSSSRDAAPVAQPAAETPVPHPAQADAAAEDALSEVASEAEERQATLGEVRQSLEELTRLALELQQALMHWKPEPVAEESLGEPDDDNS